VELCGIRIFDEISIFKETSYKYYFYQRTMGSARYLAIALVAVLALLVIIQAQSPDCTCSDVLCQDRPNSINRPDDRNYQCSRTRYLECKQNKCTRLDCDPGQYFNIKQAQCVIVPSDPAQENVKK